MNPDLALSLTCPAGDKYRAQAMRLDARDFLDCHRILGNMTAAELGKFGNDIRTLQDDCKADGDGDLTLMLRLAQQGLNTHLDALTKRAHAIAAEAQKGTHASTD